MYHSITFGDKNTWDDWCLIPETEPIISPPTQKTNYLDIPGADGSLDLSEILTGYPIFNNREGSISFIAMNNNASVMPECSPLKIRNLVSVISDHLHGKRMRMILEDDEIHYYEGRFNVEDVSIEEDFNKITIGYNLEPYKWSVNSSIDDWIWDTFNFETGVITSGILSNIPVTTTTKSITLNNYAIGTAPVVPSFIVTSTNGQGVYIRMVNTKLGIDTGELLFQNGTRKNLDYVMYGDEVTFYYRVSSGTGTLSIDYRQGRL